MRETIKHILQSLQEQPDAAEQRKKFEELEAKVQQCHVEPNLLKNLNETMEKMIKRGSPKQMTKRIQQLEDKISKQNSKLNQLKEYFHTEMESTVNLKSLESCFKQLVLKKDLKKYVLEWNGDVNEDQIAFSHVPNQHKKIVYDFHENVIKLSKGTYKLKIIIFCKKSTLVLKLNEKQILKETLDSGILNSGLCFYLNVEQKSNLVFFIHGKGKGRVFIKYVQ